MNKPVIVAITGASGSLYAEMVLQLLHKAEIPVHAVISEAGRKVLSLERGKSVADLNPFVERWFDLGDFTAPVASGSSIYRAMIVMPCSMGTLAAIANGLSVNLIHRAADVSLKERRPLLLAVRETPLNRTHLSNMLKVHDAGATVFPIMPSFYDKPISLDDMARQFAGRVLDHLGYDAGQLRRWTGNADEIVAI